MLRLTARGKINWTLDIVGTRRDGYHLMDMLMTSVELADTLELETAETLTLRVRDEASKDDRTLAAQGQESGVLTTQNDEGNLVLKAARALQRATGCEKGALMRLYKRIPMGAGMGGGSADAAAALVGLCRLWGLDVPPEKLMSIGLSLGADVPFLLVGGLARVQGIGERIEPLPFPSPCPLVLIQPCEGLSTLEMFSAFDALPKAYLIRPQTEKAQKALLAGDLFALAQAMGNVMEPVSLKRRPEMREAIAALERLGALRAMMTGSGSVVYGIFTEEEKARKACVSLSAQWKKTYLTKTARESLWVEDV